MCSCFKLNPIVWPFIGVFSLFHLYKFMCGGRDVSAASPALGWTGTVVQVDSWVAVRPWCPCFVQPAVLVNQQVWRSSTSVGGDHHKETRERERLQGARWPSVRDWRIDLSPKSNFEVGRNPGLMIVERVSRCHWCDKEEGGAGSARSPPAQSGRLSVIFRLQGRH